MFDGILAKLAARGGKTNDPMIDATVKRRIAPPPVCIQHHAKSRVQHSCDPVLLRQRDSIETTSVRLDDWHRSQTRYDRRAHTFHSAIAFAAAFILQINGS